ncbi:MAG: hypothetical protein ACN4GR_14010 [Arenicellales bacterium]
MRLPSIKYLILLLPALIAAQGCAALPVTQELQLLREDYSSLNQVKKEFDQALKGGGLSDREKADFKIWIRQLEDRVAENCLAVSARSTVSLPVDPPCEKILAGYSVPADIDIKSESTGQEKTDRMIEQLNGSLGEFDERLLREQDRVKSKRPAAETGAAGDSAGGGSDGDEAEEGNATDDSGQKKAGDKQTEQDRQPADSESGAPSKSSSEHKSTAPKDIPDGRNDDVVARQLREAAEKETDPELKKKLWDEYRRYKSGSR